MAENNAELHAKLQELDHELAVSGSPCVFIESYTDDLCDGRMATLRTKGTSAREMPTFFLPCWITREELEGICTFTDLLW
jgi:hypothetical protein